MTIDGKAIAAEILARAKARASKAPHGAPIVAALVANDTPATRSYLAIKGRRAMDAGCVLDVRTFPPEVDTAELSTAAKTNDADALLVQLPLPESIDTQAVCDAIPLEKDADVLSSAARAAFARGDADALLPPVVGAIREIFAHYSVEPRGKRAVVVGRGRLVGEPAALWLLQQGAHVTTFDRDSKLGQELLEADIVISGTGVPHLIKPYMLKEGAVLIDAGTSEQGGVLAGDADPECALKCSVFTPVPGGVGPVAVACLFDNAMTLVERTY